MFTFEKKNQGWNIEVTNIPVVKTWGLNVGGLIREEVREVKARSQRA